MVSSHVWQAARYLTVILGILASAPPAISAYHYTPLTGQVPWQTGNTINWPSSTINASQLQNLFSQFPGASQLNIHFPNQLNWSVTPQQLSSLYSDFVQSAQLQGLSGALPSLNFSSLTGAAKGAGVTMPIRNAMGDMKSQMDQTLREFRYDELNLASGLPNWLKSIILAVHDTVVNALNFMYEKIAAVF